MNPLKPRVIAFTVAAVLSGNAPAGDVILISKSSTGTSSISIKPAVPGQPPPGVPRVSPAPAVNVYLFSSPPPSPAGPAPVAPRIQPVAPALSPFASPPAPVVAQSTATTTTSSTVAPAKQFAADVVRAAPSSAVSDVPGRIAVGQTAKTYLPAVRASGHLSAPDAADLSKAANSAARGGAVGLVNSATAIVQRQVENPTRFVASTAKNAGDVGLGAVAEVARDRAGDAASRAAGGAGFKAELARETARFGVAQVGVAAAYARGGLPAAVVAEGQVVVGNAVGGVIAGIDTARLYNEVRAANRHREGLELELARRRADRFGR